MRILGLDIGKKRIGVAISDELGITAQALTTIERGNVEDIEDMIATLRSLVEKYNVKEIVVGLPRHMDGRLGEEGEDIVSLGKEIEEKIGVEVIYWDERLSTVAAERALLEADVSRRRRKKVVDRVAAAWILSGYLERRSRS